MNELVRFALVLGASFLNDICWASNIRATSQGRVLPAALWSAGIVGTGYFSIIQVIADPWNIAAAALGAALGTYFVVGCSRDHNQRTYRYGVSAKLSELREGNTSGLVGQPDRSFDVIPGGVFGPYTAVAGGVGTGPGQTLEPRGVDAPAPKGTGPWA